MITSLPFILSSLISAHAAVPTNPPEMLVREYDSNTVERVLIENGPGRITISPAERNKVFITATKRKFSEKCVFITQKSDPSQVMIKVERPTGEECEVDLDVKMPRTMNLVIASGSGNLVINDIEGALKFNMGSGSVAARGKFKHVEGTSGSGSVDISGLTGGGSINVGSGSVNLRFLESPQGKMNVQTGSGDATLNFPHDSKISATLDTGSGDTLNELQTRSDSAFAVSVKTGAGDLKVKAY